MADSAKNTVQHINPDGLHKNPAYTNVVVINGPAKTIYIGGQDAVDTAGNIIGKGDIKAQTEQIFANLKTALEAAGAEFHHVIKWNIYAVQGQPIQPAFEVFQRVWDQRNPPPLITMVFVAGLAHPDFLAEIEAVAVVPEE